jgi:hypothetical protein
VEEADAWRHSLFDRQRIAQLTPSVEPPTGTKATMAASSSSLAASSSACAAGTDGQGPVAHALSSIATAADGTDSPCLPSPTEAGDVGVAAASEVVGYLPLVDHDLAALRLRFTSADEQRDEPALLAAYLDCAVVPPPSPAAPGTFTHGTLCCVQRGGDKHMTQASRDFLALFVELRGLLL